MMTSHILHHINIDSVPPFRLAPLDRRDVRQNIDQLFSNPKHPISRLSIISTVPARHQNVKSILAGRLDVTFDPLSPQQPVKLFGDCNDV